MNPLEIKKIRVEYKKVNAAREDLELRILEAQDNIKRLEDHVKIQMAKEDELSEKIKQLEQKDEENK